MVERPLSMREVARSMLAFSSTFSSPSSHVSLDVHRLISVCVHINVHAKKQLETLTGLKGLRIYLSPARTETSEAEISILCCAAASFLLYSFASHPNLKKGLAL